MSTTDPVTGLPAGILQEFLAQREADVVNPAWHQITTQTLNVGNANFYGVLPTSIPGFHFTSGSGHASLLGSGDDASITMGAGAHTHFLTWAGSDSSISIGADTAATATSSDNVWSVGDSNTISMAGTGHLFVAGDHDTATLSGAHSTLHDANFTQGGEFFILGKDSTSFENGYGNTMVFQAEGETTQYAGANGVFDYTAAGHDTWQNMGAAHANLAVSAGVGLDVFGWAGGNLSGGGASWTTHSDGAGGTLVHYANGAQVDFHGVALGTNTHIS